LCAFLPSPDQRSRCRTLGRHLRQMRPVPGLPRAYARIELQASGEIVDITPPADVAADLARLQGSWAALRTRREAAAQQQGEARQAALEQQFHAAALDVITYRRLCREQAAQTAGEIAAVCAGADCRRPLEAMHDAAFTAAQGAAARVWAQVLRHSTAQLEQAQRAQDSHDKENAAS